MHSLKMEHLAGFTVRIPEVGRRLTQLDVEKADFRALMFQSGYLTIAEEHDGGSEYTLKCPNLEVRRSFSKKFLRYLGRDEVVVRSESGALLDSLALNDFNGFKRQVRAMLSGMSHQWFRKNTMAGYEGYYLSLLYAHFNAVGADVHGEEASSIGQADLVLRHAGQVFLMEAKLIEKLSTARVEAALSTA